MKRNMMLAAVLLVSGSAMANSARPVENPLKISLGYFRSTYSADNVSVRDGGTLALGYSLFWIENVRVELEARGNLHRLTFFGDEFDVRTYSGLVNFYLPLERGFWVSTGVGFGKADTDSEGITYSTDTELMVALQLGYNFSRSTFGAVRYQHSSEKGLRGWSAEVGFRF